MIAANEPVNVQVPSPVEPADDMASLERLPIVKKGGWLKVEMLDFDIKEVRQKVENQNEIGFTKLVPKKRTILYFECDSSVQDPITLDQCKEWPFNMRFLLREIIAFDKRNRYFSYVVIATRLGTGNHPAGEHIMKFFDEDGDGRIESFAPKVEGLYIPKWVKRLG